MWIQCSCGSQIKDITDAVQNKGHLTTDRTLFEISERQPEASLTAFEWRKVSRPIYECFECGRLWISDIKGQSFRTYVPEDSQGSGLMWKE